MRLKSISFSLLCTALAAAAAPAAARHQNATPEQRIERLEKQVRQVQGRIFPKGQPVNTAGFSDEPAASQASVTNLITRLDAVERQMAEAIRSSEENGNRIAVMEADLARLRADQERRLRALETGPAAAAVPEAVDEPVATTPAPKPASFVAASETPVTGEAGAEAAYDKGFQQWSAGQYDAAIKSLDAMIKAYPDHRRVSWANNLAGRAMLDKGQARAAAEALLANYRSDPKGERAPDSLFYLGQALMKLGQAAQACKAYGELQDVYGPTMRGQLQQQLPAARAAAKCS